jgi:hypothetical protein
VSISLAAACSLPFEYVMIQIKKRQPDGEEKYPYTGFVDCAVKTFKAGGPLKFYTGFPVYCARISPDAVVLFFCHCFILQTTIVTIDSTIIINLKFIFKGIHNFIYCSCRCYVSSCTNFTTGRNLLMAKQQ